MTESTKEELLDLFATQAMKSLVDRANGVMDPYRLAEVSYTVAERMVERRQKILQQWKLDENVVQHGIEKLNLTVRTERCLKAEGILTIQHLCGCTESRLLRLPNLGRKSLNEIVEQMAAQGYELRSGKLAAI
jgi:DNA-directed RNA polymerase subunit alpha